MASAAGRVTMRLLSRIGLAIAAVALAVGTAGPARAAVLWTLTASPLTVNAGVQTTFRLRASLTLLGEIRCVEVGVPSNFLVTGSAVTGSNVGDSWVSQVVGNDVFVRTTSGGDRLRSLGDYVEFTITATAWTAGSLAWASHTHDREDCTGPESLLSVPPVVLVLGSAATPTPVPTVAPTPAPTPTPRPSALPSLLPTLPPSTVPSVPPIGNLPTPRPSTAVGTPNASRPASPAPTPSIQPRRDAEATQAASATAVPVRASSSAAPTDSPGEAAVVGPGDGPPGGGGTTTGRILAEPAVPDGEAAPMPIALGALGLLGSIDIWIVPGLLLGVPGLLVVAFVILQAVGALAWIPAIRRLRGNHAEPAAA